MPELKQIEASIELGTSNTKLKEYGARYSDGHVETFIAVPDTDMPFSIHLTTKGYIAPGISFFVFMDSEYQCNRNKIGFKLPGDGVQPHEYETEFRLRQKEEKTSAGSFVAREWSFAKLNTVAADKSPSLNPDYIRNVGTIEIIAMRCRPASEDPPQRQASSQAHEPDVAAQKAPSKPSKANPAKLPTPQPSKAPSKAPSKTASAGLEDPFGGLFGGGFDGACDNMGLDGANDERPVRGDGRVNPEPPPGSFWDAAQGEFRPKSHFASGFRAASPHAGTDFAAGGPARAKAFIADALKEAQGAQLDGPGDWQNMGARTYPGQRQDDLRGDKYLGMGGQDRSEYKHFLRERGDAVSQTPKRGHPIEMGNGYVCTTPDVEQRIKSASPASQFKARFFLASENKGYYQTSYAGEQLLAQDLTLMHADISRRMKDNPGADLSDLQRRFHLMDSRLQEIQHPHNQQPATPAMPAESPQPEFQAIQEALEDVQLLRTKLRVIAQSSAGSQVSQALERLNKAETYVLEDSLWSDQPPPNPLDALKVRREQLSQRNTLLTQVLSVIVGVKPNYHVENIVKRIDGICDEARAAGKRIAELEGGKSVGVGQRIAVADHHWQTPNRQVNFQQGYDGAPRQQTANPTTPVQPSAWGDAGAAPAKDWQQVGAGSRKPGQQAGQGWSAPKKSSTQEHFAGEDLAKANEWKGGSQRAASGWGPVVDTLGRGEQTANAGHGSRAGSNQNGHAAWGGGSQQQQDNTGWGTGQQDSNNNEGADQKSAGKAPSNTGWGKAESNKGGTAGWASGSQKGSQKSSGGDDWGKNNAGGGGWDAQSTKSQGNNGGWGNNGQQSNANGSRSGARSVARESLASDPKDLVKPYWKDWNKAADQRSSSVASSTKPREVAREAYVYPATKLQAIPEGKVASATHGVQTGRGAEYNHMCRRPVYIDTMEKPYAVFSFKYRSKEKLKQITGLKVKSVDEDVKAVQKQVQKDKLMQMPKDQLIEQLMKSSERKGGSQKAASASGGGQGWGDKPASNANEWDKKSKTKSAASGGRGNNNGQGNGGGDGGWGASTHSKSKKSEANGGGGGWGGSSHSKSKKAEAKGWGADQGGGGDNDAGGEQIWYGQNGLAEDKAKTDTSPTGEYKFDYDAFRVPAAYPGSVDTAGGRQISESVWEGPDGLRYRGSSLVGRASWAGDSVGNSLLGFNQGGAEWTPIGDGVVQANSKW